MQTSHQTCLYSLKCENLAEIISSVVSPGEFVAQFKFTVLLMANGPLRITNSLFDPDLYKSEYKVEDPELKVKYLWLMEYFVHFLKLKY